MKLTALIHSVEDEGIFTVIKDDRKLYFYLQKNLIKKFNKYLSRGVYVVFDYEPTPQKRKYVSTYKVNHFIAISMPKAKRNRIV